MIEMLANTMVVIILSSISVSNQYIVHLKVTQSYMSNCISVKLWGAGKAHDLGMKSSEQLWLFLSVSDFSLCTLMLNYFVA